MLTRAPVMTILHSNEPLKWLLLTHYNKAFNSLTIAHRVNPREKEWNMVGLRSLQENSTWQRAQPNANCSLHHKNGLKFNLENQTIQVTGFILVTAKSPKVTWNLLRTGLTASWCCAISSCKWLFADFSWWKREREKVPNLMLWTNICQLHNDLMKPVSDGGFAATYAQKWKSHSKWFFPPLHFTTWGASNGQPS